MGMGNAGRRGWRSRIVFPLLAVTAWTVTPAPGAAQTAPTSLSTPDFTAGSGVEDTRDVVYGRIDGMALVYDVSRPADPNGAGVIFVISGGFLSSPENQSYILPVAEPLLDAGFTVFHLRHPSTPRYLAPEIYEAVKLGRDHILDHGAEFGVDPARIGVMGMSTGGLLSLLLALDVEEDRRADRGERIAAAAGYMPMVDMRDAVGQVRATPSLGFDPELAPALSPVDYVSSDDPPTLLVHGISDAIVPIDDNSRRLLPMLEDAGVEAELVEVGGGHALFTGKDKERADAAVVNWFSAHLLR